MQVIGFTTQFYTLWQVGEPYREYVTEHQWYEKQDFTYIQNLSKDLEKAKAKVKGNYSIDLELRGHKSFCRKSELINDFEIYQFSFGQLTGIDMRTCDNVWQLKRAMEQERNPRRKVIARKRLIELGELVRYTWFDQDRKNINWGRRDENGHALPEEYVYFDIRCNYATPAEVERMEAIKNKQPDPVAGHHLKNGERLMLSIKEIDSFSFSTFYGKSWVVTYRDADNRLFKYVGGNPPAVSKEEYTEVKATVEHTQYKEQQETHLKRVAVKKEKEILTEK